MTGATGHDGDTKQAAGCAETSGVMQGNRFRTLAAWLIRRLRSLTCASEQLSDPASDDQIQQPMPPATLRLAQELHAMQEVLRAKYGTFSDSAAIIRQERDERT